mgnify:CR=1 FL=1
MSKELVEKRNDLISEAEGMLDQAKEETRELTEEECSRIDEIKRSVESIDNTLKLEEEVRDLGKPIIKEEEKKVEQKLEERELMERNAFENFIRGFAAQERTGELTPATSGDNIGHGGALIPTTILDYVIRKVYEVCPILERSQKFNVKGNLAVPYYPYDSDDITVAYQSEFSAISSSSGSFATVTLGGFLAGCLTKISRSLINNLEFDIVGFVIDQMAYNIARFIEHELLVGTSSPSQKVAGLSGVSTYITAAATNAITADELIQLHDKVKSQFQNNAIWIMSPATLTAIRMLKSNTGYYLLNDDMTAPFGYRLLGKPVYVSDNMPEIAASAVPIYYGDMSGLATKFNEEVNIEVLRERYADEHAVGVVGWFEFDAKVINQQQIVKLVMHAS